MFRPWANMEILLHPGTCSCIFRSCSWLGLINVYKFPLDNFQDSSTIILNRLKHFRIMDYLGAYLENGYGLFMLK